MAVIVVLFCFVLFIIIIDRRHDVKDGIKWTRKNKDKLWSISSATIKSAAAFLKKGRCFFRVK
jgi:hypothetical protein